MTSWPSKSTLQRLLDLADLHFTTSERSGPFWQSMLHNFLSRPLSFLGWTTAMLFWLDFHQTQSNLYKWFRMGRHDWSSTSPKEPMLHLSLSPCTGYHLQLAFSSRHWCLRIEQPQAQHPPTSTHYYEFTSPPEAPPTSTHHYDSTSPPEAPPTSTHYYESTSPPEVWDLLVSDASWYHHREAQNHSPEHSRSPFLAGGMIPPPPPPPIQNAGSRSIFKQQLKTHLFQHYLTTKKKKKTSLFQNLHLSLYLSLLPLLACTYLNNARDLVLLALPLYVCLFKINRFMFASSRLIALCTPQL